MDLDAIAVFIKVVQAGSFTRAAKLLDMPNSTVSSKVSSLEKRLGLTLLTRTTRKLRLTQAGERYFAKCSRALDEIQSAEAELSTAQGEPRGVLRITAPVDFGHSLLPPIVQAYLKRFPSVRVELLVTNRVVDLVSEGVDLAIRAGELKDSTLKAKRIPAGGLGLWASPDYLKTHGSPSSPKDLQKHELLVFRPMQQGRPAKLTNGKDTAPLVGLQSRLVIDDLETVKSFAGLGQGIALLPAFLCTAEIERGALVHVLPKWCVGQLYFHFVYPSQAFVSAEVQAFIALATEMVKT